MAVALIHDAADPRIAPYRELKDRDVARHGDLFIAEGEHVVRRLLSSDFPAHSVLLDEKRVAEFAPIVPDHVPVYSAPTSLMTSIIGFRFHSGIIACGQRKLAPTLDQVIQNPGPLVICPDLNNAENLGGIIRLCAGFGAAALILGPLSVDPFWRQSIRVSMGTVFSLPIVRSIDIVADLRALRGRFAVEAFATVVDNAAESLEHVRRRRQKCAIIFGSEAHGLPTEIVAACDRSVTIPMKLGTDSLNVAVSAGIILFQLTREFHEIQA